MKTLKNIGEENPTYWLGRDHLYIHYLYKITNINNGKYYIGIHSILRSKKKDPLKDGYYGSGTEIRKALKEEGKANFKKEILKVFSTRDELREAEKKLVTKDVVSDPLSYNKTLGGGKNNCGKVSVTVKETGKKIMINQEEYYKNKNLYESSCKNLVPVKLKDDKNNNYFFISDKEYHENKELYLTPVSNKVSVELLDENGNCTGKYSLINTEEYHKYKGVKYTRINFQSNGKIICKNTNNYSDIRLLNCNDFKYLSGEYIPIQKGAHLSEKQKDKLKKEGNGMYNKLWITDEVSNKLINEGDKIPEGWRLGRTIKTIHNKKAYRNINTKELKYFSNEDIIKDKDDWKLNFLFNKNLIFLTKEHIESIIDTNSIKTVKSLATKLDLGKDHVRKLLNYYNIKLRFQTSDQKIIENNSSIRKHLYKHTCEECGKIFYTKHRNSKFCSSKCTSKYQKFTIPEKEELISKIKEFNSSKKLGEYYKVSHTTVNNWIKQLGIKDEVDEIRRSSRNKKD